MISHLKDIIQMSRSNEPINRVLDFDCFLDEGEKNTKKSLPLITLGPTSPFKGHQRSNSCTSYKLQSIEKYNQTCVQNSNTYIFDDNDDPKTPTNKKTTVKKKVKEVAPRYMLFQNKQIEQKENLQNNNISTKLKRSNSLLNTSISRKEKSENKQNILKPIQFDREKTIEELNRRRESRIELQTTRLSFHSNASKLNALSSKKLKHRSLDSSSKIANLSNVETSKRNSLSRSDSVKKVEPTKKITTTILNKSSNGPLQDSLTNLQLLQTELLDWCYINCMLEHSYKNKTNIAMEMFGSVLNKIKELKSHLENEYSKIIERESSIYSKELSRLKYECMTPIFEHLNTFYEQYFSLYHILSKNLHKLPTLNTDVESIHGYLPTIKETFHILNRFNSKFEYESSIWFKISEEMSEIVSIIKEEIEDLNEYFNLLEEYTRIELLERSLTIQRIQNENTMFI